MKNPLPSAPNVTYRVESTSPARLGPQPYSFVDVGDFVRLAPAGDLFTLEVTRGLVTSYYPDFRWDGLQKIWWCADLKFDNATWYHEIKVADFSKNGLIYTILYPTVMTSGEDPDSTGGYTARGQAG